MALARQKLVSAPVGDPGACMDSVLGAIAIENQIQPGQTVAIAIGSRRIHAISEVVAQCVKFFEQIGLSVVIVPAMGSHGGATPKGQVRVLDALGIIKACPQIPIHAQMDVICLGKLKNNIPVFFSKPAMEADHLVVINRVKPHTKFSALIQSGLCKMLCVGLGKAKGAATLHRAAVSHGFSIIEDAASLILKKRPVLLGIALVEDGNGRLSCIEALKPKQLINREKALLKKASSMMGKIPFKNLDVLVVDKIGKDISGIGMDSNVTGRHRDITGDFFRPPNPRRIFVRDLSFGSEGNANGIGLADFTTTRLVKAMDLQKTFINAITAISPEKAAIPAYFDTDKKCLEACLATTGLEDFSNARLVRIVSTGVLDLLHVSKALEQEIKNTPGLEIITNFEPMKFDKNENLADFYKKSHK